MFTWEAELAGCKLSALLRSMVLGTAGGPVSQTGPLANLVFWLTLLRAICLGLIPLGFYQRPYRLECQVSIGGL